MSTIAINDVCNWHSLGRGRSFGCYLTDAEMQALLLEFAQAHGASLSLVTECSVQVKQRPRRYDWYAREDDLAGYLDLIAAGEWQFFIRERSLTPHVEIGAKLITPGYLPVNGLLDLNAGTCFPSDHEHLPGMRRPSSLGMVERVASEVTGEVRERTGYCALYFRLKLAIRKKLVYATEVHSDAIPVRVSPGPRMSEAFVAAIDGGGVKPVDRVVLCS